MVNWPISIRESKEVTAAFETVSAGPHVTPPMAPRRRSVPRASGWVTIEGRYEAISEGCVYYPLGQIASRACGLAEALSEFVEEFGHERVAVLSYAKSQDDQALPISDTNDRERPTMNLHSRRQKENKEREK